MPALDRVQTLAFSGRLRDAEAALGVPGDAEARWWAAYLANATGRFDEALTLALEIAEESGDARLASKALVTAASALRHLQRHLPALPLDESALRLAPDDGTAAHALVGLGADAVGLGRETEAASRIDEAARVAPPGDWRVRVRLAWVRCEHAMLAGRVRKAITHARDAADRSIAAKARRHQAKSLLLLGYALREAGESEWLPTLRRAREMATRIGAAPIAEVASRAIPARGARSRAPGSRAPGSGASGSVAPASRQPR